MAVFINHTHVVSLLIVLLSTPATAKALAGERARPESPTAASSERSLLQSSRTGSDESLSKAIGDTFYLYGGPGTNEGKFQDVLGNTPDRQGWVGVDWTMEELYWQVATFNAANLGGHGAGNRAMWCGRDAQQEPGWATAPGYGDSWYSQLLWESPPLSDPASGQTVGLDFVFNHDTEPQYDFLLVEYETAQGWIQTLAVDGTNADASGVFPSPGAVYSDVGASPILYEGDDYGGTLRDRIRIRLIVSSDGAWSDEDGRFPSSGAAQVDDISVTWSDGASFEDFEGETPFAWSNARRPFAGEFSKVFAQAQDLDPCRTTNSPLMTFIDDGSPVGNSEAALQTFGVDSTGGTTSLNWSYGVQGGWVVNYNGGLSLALVSLNNSVWSPPIEWNLPGPEDDGPECVGAFLRFSAWAHLPLLNGIYYTWKIRASTDGTLTWGPWEDYTFVWHNPNPVWENRQFEVGPLLPGNPTHVQLSFGVYDLSDLIEFPDYDATPAPWFDNIALAKYALAGPAITARDIDLAQSGFPLLGSIDASSTAARDFLDVRFDMARDINTRGLGIIPGDSIIADVEAIIPGTNIADVRMRWVLDRNPLFDDVRSPPSRSEDILVDTEFAPNQWYGEVLGQPSTSGGVPLVNRFFFDLPDADFLHPGDTLRYVLQATDSEGRITTLPADVTGLEDGTDFDRRFTVRGLPSLRDESGSQPSILVINDAFNRGFDEELQGAHAQIGLREGLDFDQFDVLGPTSGVSNGIGSAGGHGANADQLAGYSTIIYHAADLSFRLLSDGSNNDPNDKSNDLSVLTVWYNLPGNRHGAFFGDSFASTVNSESASGASFVQDVLRVQVDGPDVGDLIGDAKVPLVGPVNPLYVTTIAAYGSCPRIARFDNFRPLSPAERSHAWLGPNLVPVPGVAAGIRLIDSDPFGARKTMLTIPIGFDRIGNTLQRAPVQPSARAILLREILDDFGVGSGAVPSSASSPATDLLALRAAPNPFNPRTVIRLQLGESQHLRLSVLNVRGELVRQLYEGELSAGVHPFVWDGADRRGEPVASGVYVALARVEGGRTERLKLALLR